MADIDVRIDPELDAFVEESRQLNKVSELATQQSPSFATAEGLAQLRSGDGMPTAGTVAEAADIDIPGPAGAVPARVLVPPQANAVMLFLHGGGWCIGDAKSDEVGLWELANAAEVAIVSPNYRLAPEHPYPAALDDCEAAAVWLLEHGRREWGGDRLVLAGGSAGGHLAATTLLRLRDRHDAIERVAAANLVAGLFDLGLTPSARTYKDAAMIPLAAIAACLAHFVPDLDPEQRRAPDISPLYADLTGMPPALFTVGTLDPLIDDSLFMAARWRCAGGEAEVAIYPESVHGFAAFPTAMAHAARARMTSFIRQHTSG